jgi:serine/alanine adding enzyme
MLIKRLENSGVKWSGLTTDMGDTIQPRYNAVIHQESFSEDALSKNASIFMKSTSFTTYF